MPEPLTDLRRLCPERVCLIKPSSLGDVVHALPVLSALRALWPGAEITWVVNSSLRGLLDGHPELDRVIAFDRGRAAPGPRRPGDGHEVPGEPAPRAVRPRHRPARAAPLGADDPRHRGTRPGRARRRPRGGGAVLHPPHPLARPRDPRRRPPPARGRGARGFDRGAAVRRGGRRGRSDGGLAGSWPRSPALPWS